MDEEQLRAELENCHPESFGWALSCCSQNPNDAEEVLQEAYLKVLDGRARFDSRATVKTWLLALIRNTAADHWRRKTRAGAKLADYEATAEGARLEPAPDVIVQQQQMRDLLRQRLAALPERQREVLHLVFYHDLSISQAAEVMSVSVGSARTHYERGKQQLRDWLERFDCDHETELRRKNIERTVP